MPSGDQSLANTTHLFSLSKLIAFTIDWLSERVADGMQQIRGTAAQASRQNLTIKGYPRPSSPKMLIALLRTGVGDHCSVA